MKTLCEQTHFFIDRFFRAQRRELQKTRNTNASLSKRENFVFAFFPLTGNTHFFHTHTFFQTSSNMQVSTDALACIYAYCGLLDVLQCTRVSKHWAHTAAVSPPLPGSAVCNIDSLISSRFRGLIERISVVARNYEFLQSMAIYFPRISQMFLYYSPIPMQWSHWPRLHTLELVYGLAPSIHSLPPLITDLTMSHLPPSDVLASCTLLRRFRIHQGDMEMLLSLPYTRVLRQLPHLEKIFQPTQQLPYKQILPLYELPRANNVEVLTLSEHLIVLTTLDNDAPALFKHIPHALSVDITGATCDLDFLVQRIEHVTVSRSLPDRYNTPDLLFSFLMRCTQLCSLELGGIYHATDHLRSLAKQTPRVHTFTISRMTYLESLDFLPTWPLTHLTIRLCMFSENELIHITRLPLLHTLCLDKALNVVISSEWRTTLEAIPSIQSLRIR